MEALLKTDAKTLERRVGHAKGRTDRYIIAAEAVGLGQIGDPFGPLPQSLVLATVLAIQSAQNEKAPAVEGAVECRRRESNPRPSAYETPALAN
jgi:hypothetical protein